MVSQEIVDENAEIIVTPENQYNPSGERAAEGAEHEIRFGQIYLSKPTITEADGETSILFPKEARLRNLTCALGARAPAHNPTPPCRPQRFGA